LLFLVVILNIPKISTGEKGLELGISSDNGLDDDMNLLFFE